MGQIAPSVQQMIANQPALQAQMATRAFELQNQRNAQGYQNTDQIVQGLLRAMGMYGDMQQRKEDRATAATNKADDNAFRDKKFDYDKTVGLEKLRLDGNLSDAQIAQMEANGELLREQADRLHQITPSEVRQRTSDADMSDAQFQEFKDSGHYRRAVEGFDLEQRGANVEGTQVGTQATNDANSRANAMQEFSLQQAEANVASTKAGTAATTGAEGRAAGLHPSQRTIANNAAMMSTQEFSEWMMSPDFRQQMKQLELDQRGANVENTRANTDSTRSKRWRDEDMAPLDRMQAEANILGTRSQTTARDMLLLPQRDNLNANTRGQNASANQSERLLPGQVTGQRLGNLQTEEQIRGMAGQEDRAQARHPGEMDLQWLGIASARLALEDSAIKHTFLKAGLEAEHQNLLSRTGLQDAQASVLEAQARIAKNPVAASPEKWQKSVQEEMTSIEFNFNSRIDSISTMLGNDTLLKEMMRTPQGKDALLSLTIEQARIMAALPKLSQLRITMADGTFTTENGAWSALGNALGAAGGGKLNPKPLAPQITPPGGGGLTDEETFNVGGTTPK